MLIDSLSIYYRSNEIITNKIISNAAIVPRHIKVNKQEAKKLRNKNKIKIRLTI